MAGKSERGEHLSFASVKKQPILDEDDEEEQQQLYAGMSSAAACIVLELPRGPPSSSESSSKSCIKITNKKRRTQRQKSGIRCNNTPSVEQINACLFTTSQSCHRFKPVYTHQFFPNEKMRGYRPTEQALLEAKAVFDQVNGEEHSSFDHHGAARYTLSIQVRLSPSCRRSCLVVRVMKIQRPMSIIARTLLSRQSSNVHSEVSCDEIDEDGEGTDEEYELTSSNSRKRRRNSGSCSQLKEFQPQTRRSGRLKNGTAVTSNGRRRSQRGRVQLKRAVYASDESENDDTKQQQKKQRQRKVTTPMSIRRSSRKSTSPFKKPRGAATVGGGTSLTNSHSLHSRRALFSVNESPTTSAGDAKTCAQVRQSRRLQSKHHSADESGHDTDVDFSSDASLSTSVPTSTGDPKLDNISRIRIDTVVKYMSRGLPGVGDVLIMDGDSCSVGGEEGIYKSLSESVESIDDIDNDYLDEPVGETFIEYTRKKTIMSLQGSGFVPCQLDSSDEQGEAEFVLTLADMRSNKKAREYHDEVEKLAPWFIEVADCVDMGSSKGIEEDDGGHWKVMYMFEKHQSSSSSSRYSLAGYMTFLYTEKQKQKTKMVVCQALLLPPYQRSGHGTDMLRSAYALAHGECVTQNIREPVDEINVESPAPAFVALRDRIDFSIIKSKIEKEYHSQKQPPIPHHYIQPLEPHSLGVEADTKAFAVLPNRVLNNVSSVMKITPRQVQVAFEIWKLGELEKCIKNAASSSVSTLALNKSISLMEGHYKAMVKKSLLKTLRENETDEIFGTLSIDEQMERLEAHFSNTIVHYQSILRSVSRDEEREEHHC